MTSVHDYYMSKIFHFLKFCFFFSLQTQCQPHLTETVKESVEGICLKIYHLSSEYAKKVRDKQNEIYKEQGITGMNKNFKIYATLIRYIFPHFTTVFVFSEPLTPASALTTRKVWCYPIQFAAPCPRLPTIDCVVEKDSVVLRYLKNDPITIHAQYMHKLVGDFGKFQKKFYY